MNLNPSEMSDKLDKESWWIIRTVREGDALIKADRGGGNLSYLGQPSYRSNKFQQVMSKVILHTRSCRIRLTINIHSATRIVHCIYIQFQMEQREN